MRFIWIWILCLLAVGETRGAFEPKCISPRGGALGGLLTLRDPGGDDSTGSVFVIFTPGFFNLPELSMAAAGVSRRDGSKALTLTLSRFGGDLYREWEGSAVAEFGVDSLARIGGGVTLRHLRIAGHGSLFTGGASLYGGVQVDRDLAIRFALLNLLSGRIGPDPVPRILACALAWAPLDGSRLFLEVRLESDQQAAWSAGGEWEFVERAWIRAGSSSDHPGLDAGLGIAAGRIRFDYAFRWHRDLGGSHFLSIVFHNLL